MSSLTKEQMISFGILEEYMQIPEFPSYEVSNYGNIRNANKFKLLKLQLYSTGYLGIKLKYKDGNYK
jgi:hypothetical protein